MFKKIHFKGREWTDDLFSVHWVPDQVRGILYAGITCFGYSVLYSDHW